MALVLPLNSDLPTYKFVCTLGTVQYGFRVRWNARDNYDPATQTSGGAWYLDVSDDSGNAIGVGIKVALGAFMGRQFKHPLFRQSALVAVDLSGAGRDATRFDLGTRVQVEWLTVAELLSLRIISDFPDTSSG